jgi:predicted translin family RNA/ssDNA-binding protein
LGYESYLGGLCDLTGELVRRAVNRAAAGYAEEVSGIKAIIDDIMAELVAFDMTGYLRTKYDQAKGNLRKIEQISYEIKIRK